MVVGEPENTDGLLTTARETVDVRGLPDALPSSFEVDVSILAEIDQAIHVSDLVMPEGVELITDGEEMLVKLSAPTLQIEVEEEVTDEELEDAALAGGEEVAEGEGDAEASDEEQPES
jgi:large subunit ribosomal protein L25